MSVTGCVETGFRTFFIMKIISVPAGTNVVKQFDSVSI